MSASSFALLAVALMTPANDPVPSSLSANRKKIERLGGSANDWGTGVVEVVALQGRKFRDEHVELLIPFEDVVSIYLIETEITAAGVHRLIDVVKDRNVSGIEIQSDAVGDELCEKILGVKTLEKLALRGTGVTDRGFTHLDRLPALVWLDVRGTPITNAGMRSIAQCRRLKTLWLSGTSVTDEGIVMISELTDLQSLLLNETKISDAGLAHLTKMQKLTALQLGHTAITGEGLKYIGQLKSLANLDLKYTAVAGEDLEYLTPLANLTDLHLDNTNVDIESICRLQERLPKLVNVHFAGQRVPLVRP